MKTLEIRGLSGTSRILVGENAGHLSRHLPPGRTIFITDENVRRAQPAIFEGRDPIVIPAGEESKTLETVAGLYDRLLALEADRATFLVGVGGGVVCDIAGFAASTYLRGLSFGYVATTLLAQADASVGGKTGVNFGGFKNLVGVFSQPRFVLCDPAVLGTLPASEVRNGLAEIVKHAAIASPSLFSALEGRGRDLLSLPPDLIEEIVLASVSIKAAIVSGDERESGERRKLNFGHTLGHAFESTLGLSHGEAVSLGMAAAADFSVRRGLLSESDARRLRALLEAFGLPTTAAFDRNRIAAAVGKDKKRAGRSVKFVFLRAIGEAVVEDVDLGESEAYVQNLR